MPDHSKIREVIRNSLPINYDYAKAAAEQGGPPITSSESETRYRYCNKDNCAGYALASLGVPRPIGRPLNEATGGRGTEYYDIIGRIPPEREVKLEKRRWMQPMDSLQIKSILEDMLKKEEDGLVMMGQHTVAITYKDGRLYWNEQPQERSDFTLQRKKVRMPITREVRESHKHIIRNYDVTAEPWFRKLYPKDNKIFGFYRISKR